MYVFYIKCILVAVTSQLTTLANTSAVYIITNFSYAGIYSLSIFVHYVFLFLCRYFDGHYDRCRSDNSNDQYDHQFLFKWNICHNRHQFKYWFLLYYFSLCSFSFFSKVRQLEVHNLPSQQIPLHKLFPLLLLLLLVLVITELM